MKGLLATDTIYAFLRKKLRPWTFFSGSQGQNLHDYLGLQSIELVWGGPESRIWRATTVSEEKRNKGSSVVGGLQLVRGFRASPSRSGTAPGEGATHVEEEEFVLPRFHGHLEQSSTRRNCLDQVFAHAAVTRSQLVWHRMAHCRHYAMLPILDGGTWTRVTGAYAGPMSLSFPRNPFRDGSVRYKSRNKIKKAKQKKREILAKIKRIRVASTKRKEDMTPEELLEFRLEKGSRKIALIQQQIAKFPVQEIPPVDQDVEVLTPEQMHYLKKIGYKNKNYVPVGRRGVYGGTIQNIHMHWKKHETVQVEIAGFTKDEIKVMADQLARLSGGLVIDIHQGNIVILYRGRNYKAPNELIPMKTLDKRKALMKSKLEQSMKALIENNKKVTKELAALRKDNAQWLAAHPENLEEGLVHREGSSDQDKSNPTKNFELNPRAVEVKMTDSDSSSLDYDSDSTSDEEWVSLESADSEEDDSDSDFHGENVNGVEDKAPGK